ncbi:MAG: TonB-dependent receptor [Bacteroidota bacterium]|jgi:TonB-linked SusC/RagA family outer membrane protein|nr:MAG: TonB-dependent receptor [Bacteroidota bacterium]
MRRILPLIPALILFLLPIVLQAQQRTISGTVTSQEDGSPLPGVNVLLQGTSLGSITDVNGRYSIAIPQQGGVLVFSFVGFITQAREIGPGDVLDVQLEVDARQLEEVVITGYGDPQDKRKYTGSVAQVGSNLIENVPVATMDQMLQGRAAGVMVTANSGQPGTPAFVRIRGLSSLASVSPLYIMDGVPISAGDFAALNPNDIESINILKDAASSSLYGTRGANGVIVITTKRGGEGIRMHYNAQYGITTRTNAKFDMMNTAQKIQFERLMAEFGLYQGEVGRILQDGSLSSAEKEQRIAELARINTDWTDVFFRDGITQMHELSASGGTERSNFYLSANYRTEEGIIKESDLQRYSLRFNFDHYASEKFSFGVSNSIGYTKTNFLPTETGNNVNNPVLYAFIANPYTRVKNPDTGEFEEGPTGFNLVEQMEQSHNRQEQLKIVSGAYLRYEFIPGLVAKTNWGIDFSETLDDFRINAGAPNQSGITGEQGVLTRGYGRLASIIGTTTLQYAFNIKQDHNVRVLVGQEMMRGNTNGFSFNGYGLNDKLRSPAAIAEGTATNNFIPDVGGFNTDNALFSLFLDGLYAYRDRFTVSFNVRRDGSSRFGTNKRYANFYSVGASWNLIVEDFISQFAFINDLKLRASYGTQGRQTGIGDFQSLALYGSGFSYAGQQGIAPVQPANPDLQWEQTATLDIGLDFSVLNERISGTIDFYNKLTTDLFIDTPLSRTSGFTSLNLNAGDMRNRGIEVTLHTRNIVRRDFTWSTDLNVTFNDNEVVKLNFETDATRETGFREGLPLGTFALVEWAGVNPANGDPLYRDKNGNITNVYNADDAVAKFGTWDPPRFGGLTNTFTYKGIELSVFFSFQHGNKLLNNQRFFNNNPLNFGQFNQSVEQLRAWRNPGDITNVPRVTAQREFSSQDLEDASFIRLRNVSLAYFLPQKLITRTKLKSVKIYLQAQNLYTFTEYSGFDPEDAGSVSLSQYPVPRVFTGGIDIGF